MIFIPSCPPDPQHVPVYTAEVQSTHPKAHQAPDPGEAGLYCGWSGPCGWPGSGWWARSANPGSRTSCCAALQHQVWREEDLRWGRGWCISWSRRHLFSEPGQKSKTQLELAMHFNVQHVSHMSHFWFSFMKHWLSSWLKTWTCSAGSSRWTLITVAVVQHTVIYAI